jgi:hypothetical protein
MRLRFEFLICKANKVECEYAKRFELLVKPDAGAVIRGAEAVRRPPKQHFFGEAHLVWRSLSASTVKGRAIRAFAADSDGRRTAFR